jgi:hypothetical protein
MRGLQMAAARCRPFSPASACVRSSRRRSTPRISSHATITSSPHRAYRTDRPTRCAVASMPSGCDTCAYVHQCRSDPSGPAVRTCLREPFPSNRPNREQRLIAHQVLGQGDAHVVTPQAASRKRIAGQEWIRADHGRGDGVAPADVGTPVTRRGCDATPPGAAHAAIAEREAALERTCCSEFLGLGAAKRPRHGLWTPSMCVRSSSSAARPRQRQCRNARAGVPFDLLATLPDELDWPDLRADHAWRAWPGRAKCHGPRRPVALERPAREREGGTANMQAPQGRYSKCSNCLAGMSG